MSRNFKEEAWLPKAVEDTGKLDNWENPISKYLQNITKDIDNALYEFLIKNGYKVDKPYNFEQLEELKKDLAKEDKFLDFVEVRKHEGNGIKVQIIPFFNRFSHPISHEEVEEIMQEWDGKDERI